MTRFGCAKCDLWTEAAVRMRPDGSLKPRTVFCKHCGGMIHSGEFDSSAAGDQTSAEHVEARCTAPGCGELVKGVTVPGKLFRAPCPACGRTVILGNLDDSDPTTTPSGDFFSRALQEIAITQEYMCTACRKKWTQTVIGAEGAKRMVRCPNASCPQPADMEIVISEEE